MRIIVVIFLVLFLFVPRVGTEQVAVIGGNYVPTHLRIDNSLTESEMFESAEKGIEWFMRNWNIKGSSVAIAKGRKALVCQETSVMPLSLIPSLLSRITVFVLPVYPS